jgi:hypothetical protein
MPAFANNEVAMKLAFKVLLFTLIMPGTFSVYVPHLLLRPEGLARILRASGRNPGAQHKDRDLRGCGMDELPTLRPAV